jgi:hypothetical protein
MKARSYVDGRLTRPELVEEAAWMLEASVHPRLIAQELGRSVAAIEKAARDEHRPDIAAAFRHALSEDRRVAA